MPDIIIGANRFLGEGTKTAASQKRRIRYTAACTKQSSPHGRGIDVTSGDNGTNDS
jgi:hypothetical protein